jgi:hypothetical protein
VKNVKEFLDLCQRRFPSPRTHQRHSLTLDGNTLVLTLMQGDTYQRFNLDDEDLKKPPTQLLLDLIAVMNTPTKGPKKPTPPDSNPRGVA